MLKYIYQNCVSSDAAPPPKFGPEQSNFHCKWIRSLAGSVCKGVCVCVTLVNIINHRLSPKPPHRRRCACPATSAPSPSHPHRPHSANSTSTTTSPYLTLATTPMSSQALLLATSAREKERIVMAECLRVCRTALFEGGAGDK